MGDAWIGYSLIKKYDPIHSMVLGHFLNLPVVGRDQHHPPF